MIFQKRAQRLAFLAALLASGVLCAGLLLRAPVTRPIIFPAPDFRFTPALPGGRMVTARGERTTFGYYAPGGKRLVVFFHGNGEVMGSMQDTAAEILQQGSSVLLAEYPGYGYAAAYRASEKNIYADAQLLLETVRREYRHAKENTVLWGFSLGTGVAVEMAARGMAGSLVLMAPFTSVAHIVEKHLTRCARFLVVDRFDSASKAAALALPVLILHGDQDQVVPVEQARQLYRLFPRARYFEVRGADHNDIRGHITPGSWRAAVRFAAQGN